MMKVLMAVLVSVLVVGCGIGGVVADTMLVPAGSTWRYLDDGTDQGTAWKGVAFVDTAWAWGPAQLGYGDGDEATVLIYGPDPDNKHITTYFRHTVEVSDPAAYACLRLRLLRDDGAVIYLNGTEIGRSNVPDGAIDCLTHASSAVASAEENAFHQSYVLADGLTLGTNVIAVEIHQVSGTSSDISFDLELVGLTALPDLMRKAPYPIYGGTNTQMQINWQLIFADTCVIEWGEDTSYSLGSEETVEYGTDHQHAYTITGLTPGTLYYYQVLLGGVEHTGSFRAAPPADAASVRFFAYGDTRTYPADHDAVAAGVLAKYTADTSFQTLIVCVGDLVTDGDLESDWDEEFFDPSYTNLSTMLATLPYQAAMGNHEESGVLFTKYFPYPFVSGRYWSFDYGPAHFTVVDQYTSYGPGSAQLSWIETDLASTTKPWKFVYLHEPGWSAGGHANNTSVQNHIQPLCEQYGVAILFAGHNHYYARAVVNGVQHVTAGGGGAPLRTPNPSYPNVVTTAEAHHFCTAEIDGGVLHFEAISSAGVLLDSLTLTLPGADVEDPAGEDPLSHLSLGPARPNPFERCTSIDLSVPQESGVLLELYDVRGRRVRTLLSGVVAAGYHNLEWDGNDDRGVPAPAGLYFCQLRSGKHLLVRKIVLMR